MLEVLIDEIRLKPGKDRLLLSNIRFSAGSKQVLTIAGKNGTGKSTLLKAIPRLLDSRLYTVNGKVFFNGSNILAQDQKNLREIRKNKIKYVMQDSSGSFDPLKKFRYYFELAFENNNTNIKEAKDLLEFFFLPDADKLFKLHPYEISGGMAQRISFILALMAHPQILLLDEPTSGIDSPISNLLLLKIKEFVSAEQASVLLVTHDLRFAEKISDSIAILAGGILSDFYTREELNNNGLFNTAFGDGVNEYLA
jgi:peptide/nickel transport system ATP-binding protein